MWSKSISMCNSMFTNSSGHSLQTYCAKKYLRNNLYFVNFQRHITAANLETDQMEMCWHEYVKRMQNQNWSPHHRLLSHQFNPRILDIKWSKNLVSMQQKQLIFRMAERKNFRWAEANNCQDGCREARERWRRRRKRRKRQKPQSGRRLRHCRWYWEGEWRTERPQTIFFSLSGIRNLSFSNNLWMFCMDNYANSNIDNARMKPNMNFWERKKFRSLKSWSTYTAQTKWPNWCKKWSLLLNSWR